MEADKMAQSSGSQPVGLEPLWGGGNISDILCIRYLHNASEQWKNYNCKVGTK